MLKSGLKDASKRFAKTSGSSRGSSSWSKGSHGGGSKWSSHRSGEGLSWFSGSGPTEVDSWRDRLDDGEFGADLRRALGEGLANGLGDEISSRFEAGNGSASFWQGVAACALLFAAVILVIYLNG